MEFNRRTLLKDIHAIASTSESACLVTFKDGSEEEVAMSAGTIHSLIERAEQFSSDSILAEQGCRDMLGPVNK